MSANSVNPQCCTCINYVRLTPTEQDLIKPRLALLDPPQRKTLGVCLRPRRQPTLLIREYIDQDDDWCELYEHGYHKEKIGVACPSCRTGDLSISRPLINGMPVILIGCNRFPDCRFSIRATPLPKTLCRYCRTPLWITGGAVLRCFCPTCKRGTDIPISLRTWPSIVKPEGGCVHFDDQAECPTCEASRAQRKSLLEIELPIFVQWQKDAAQLEKIARLEAENGVARASLGSNDDAEDLGEDDWADDSDDFGGAGYHIEEGAEIEPGAEEYSDEFRERPDELDLLEDEIDKVSYRRWTSS